MCWLACEALWFCEEKKSSYMMSVRNLLSCVQQTMGGLDYLMKQTQRDIYT